MSESQPVPDPKEDHVVDPQPDVTTVTPDEAAEGEILHGSDTDGEPIGTMEIEN